MNRPRILFLNHVAILGGAERSLAELAAHIDASRFTLVATTPEPGPLPDLLATTGIKTHAFPFRRFTRTVNPFKLADYILSVLRTVPGLVNLVWREKIDILHANSTTAHIYALMAARATGRPCIWHCRDLVELGPLGRWLCHRSDRIIAVSHAVANHLQRYGANKPNLSVIHNGIPINRLPPPARDPSIRSRFGIPSSSILVLLAGEIVPWKNHALFLQAASLAAHSAMDIRFIIAGTDTFGTQAAYMRRIRTLARVLEIDRYITFAGHVENMAPLYAASDMLVHAAAREPFGRVLVEAMAAGLPVVAVDAAGPAEIVRTGVDGLLVLPSSPAQMARAILQLARDSALRQRLGASARRRIQESFDIASTSRHIEAVYDSLLCLPHNPASSIITY